MNQFIKIKTLNVLLRICPHCGNFGRRLGMSLKYHHNRGKWPNFRHPHDLSERILSSMCEPSFLKYADLADKVKVRDYIKSKGLERILLKHYKVWNSPSEITLESLQSLPDKFILKPNNGSGGHVYCRDKNKFDLECAKQTLQGALDRAKDYFFEPHYLIIEPKVYAEELLDLGEGKVLTDYKFHCIKGKIADVFIAGENAKGERKYATLDLNWNVLPHTKEYYLLNPIPPQPECFSEMKDIALILSKDFDFVRVDLYEYDGKVYFSELTFSPWGGYMYSYTDEALAKMGEQF